MLRGNWRQVENDVALVAAEVTVSLVSDFRVPQCCPGFQRQVAQFKYPFTGARTLLPDVSPGGRSHLATATGRP